MIARRPEAAQIPQAIASWADGRRLEPIWENELGGLTFRAGAGAGAQFVKWSPHASNIDLGEEIRRLRWAGSFTLVPQVLDQGADEQGSWFSTAGIAGLSAVDEQWITRPEVAVTAIGAGLRRLHESLPVKGVRSVGRPRIAWRTREPVPRPDGSRRLEPGPSAIDGESVARPSRRATAGRSAGGVCHGDACAPNTLLAADGSPLAHVDLGSLGVADRWADLAIATRSTGWNYGPGWEALLLDAYGIDPDPARTAYYRLLWDLGP